MQPHRTLLLSLLLLAIPTTAHADDGVGIGPRTWDYLRGVGIEYRAADLVVELAGFGGVGESEHRDEGVPGSDVGQFQALAIRFGVLRDVAEVGPVSLAVGARVGLWRERNVSDYESIRRHDDHDADVLELPLRVRYEIGRRLALHADFGVELRRAERSSYFSDEYEDRVDVSTYRTRSAQLFGGNLGSVGLTYAF